MLGTGATLAFLGLDGFRWTALLVTGVSLLLLGDAFVGHYRTGFRVKAQYAPFAGGAILAGSAAAAAIAPAQGWATSLLAAGGWLAVVVGIVGTGFHHWYGVRRQPGGYSWLLHNLMYKAPPLAPLALSAAGGLAVLAADGLANLHGRASSAALDPSPLGRAILLLSALAIAGLTVQSLLLHYRGAFHNVLMYAPAVAPLAAAVLGGVQAVAPRATVGLLLVAALWLSFITGFAGLGMHLRGLDRHMGGLYVGRAVVLEGPPLFAPGVISGFAATGLVAHHLLLGQ